MKPVDQTTFGHPGGNCFSACVASILELPIEDVPYFMEPELWWPPFLEWLSRCGYSATYWPGPDGFVPPGYSIMGGESFSHPPGSGKLHAVVALDGELSHDPNPRDGRRGVRTRLDFVTLERTP